MRKRFLSKLIVLVVAFMCLINGILPTKTYALTTHKYNDLYYWYNRCFIFIFYTVSKRNLSEF